MGQTVQVKGEGGAVWEMDYPLRPDMAERVRAGILTIVSGQMLTPEPAPLLDDIDEDAAGEAEMAAMDAALDAEIAAGGPAPTKRAATKKAVT